MPKNYRILTIVIVVFPCIRYSTESNQSNQEIICTNIAISKTFFPPFDDHILVFLENLTTSKKNVQRFQTP